MNVSCVECVWELQEGWSPLMWHHHSTPARNPPSGFVPTSAEGSSSATSSQQPYKDTPPSLPPPPSQSGGGRGLSPWLAEPASRVPRGSKSGHAASNHSTLLRKLDLSRTPTRGVAQPEGVSVGEGRQERGRGEGLQGMSVEEKEEVRQMLAEAEEVAVTLVYNNGSTQLRSAESEV